LHIPTSDRVIARIGSKDLTYWSTRSATFDNPTQIGVSKPHSPRGYRDSF